MKTWKLISCVAGVLGMAQMAGAATIYTVDGTENWYPVNNSGGGTTTITSDQPRAANLGGDPGSAGSLKLFVPSGDKATANFPVFSGPLGTLGALTTGTAKASFDYYVDPSNTTSDPNAAPTYRLYVTPADNSFTSLVWERTYQPGTQTAGVWNDNVDVTNDKFWIRSHGHNFDQIANMHTLAEWASGVTVTDGAFSSAPLSASSSVDQFETGFGSGITGNFTGFVDDFYLQFNAGNLYTANFEVPEPAALGLFAIGGLFLARRSRKNRATA